MTNFKKFLALPLLVAVFAFSFAGAASAQLVSPQLGVQLLTSGLTSPLVANATSSTVARLVLDTTGSSEAVRISSVPFILTTGGGAIPSTLNDCVVWNEAGAGSALSTSNSSFALSSGLNTANLTSSLILPANTVSVLALRCDVANNLVDGGTYTFSVNTANVAAVGVNTGLQAAVYVRGATVPPVIPPVIPGLPNTGAGGEATTNLAIILGSVLVAGFALYTARKTVRA